VQPTDEHVPQRVSSRRRGAVGATVASLDIYKLGGGTPDRSPDAALVRRLRPVARWCHDDGCYCTSRRDMVVFMRCPCCIRGPMVAGLTGTVGPIVDSLSVEYPALPAQWTRLLSCLSIVAGRSWL
jgi:hypothetical protein